MRCARAVIPHLKKQGWGRIINISGTNARNAGNLSGGARNASLVHMAKTLAVQLGRFGITVNCIHRDTTRTERTPRLLAVCTCYVRNNSNPGTMRWTGSFDICHSFVFASY